MGVRLLSGDHVGIEKGTAAITLALEPPASTAASALAIMLP